MPIVLMLAALACLQGAIYASHTATASEQAQVHSLYPWMYRCESRAPEIGAWVRAHKAI